MTTELSIVIAEDSELLREEMQFLLRAQGWQVHGVDCGESLSEWLRTHTPNIAILDINLPYEDGYSIATRLRNSHPDMGIIMLTARVRPSDRAEGYRVGVDVYLTKPSSGHELVSVISTLANRLAHTKPTGLTLNRAQNLLINSEGKVCRLTGSERRFLELLVLAPERKQDHYFIIENLTVNQTKPMSIETLIVQVSRLRSKCKRVLSIDNIVLVDRGFGYRLAVPIAFID